MAHMVSPPSTRRARGPLISRCVRGPFLTVKVWGHVPPSRGGYRVPSICQKGTGLRCSPVEWAKGPLLPGEAVSFPPCQGEWVLGSGPPAVGPRSRPS